MARLAAGVAVAGLACVAWGSLVERHLYVLRRVTLEGALTRPGRLTVLHVSDVHLAPRQARRIRFLASLARLVPDLTVITGDLLGARGGEDVAVAAVAGLTGPGRPGVFVLGSNDVLAPRPVQPLSYLRRDHERIDDGSLDPGRALDTQRLIDGLAAHGYVTLRGEARVLDTPAGRVAVGGFDDPHMTSTVLPDPTAVAPPDDDVVLRLGVVHAPYLAALDVLVDAGHDVLLSGHTHGGQVRLPGIGALTTNCDLPLSQARGASRHRGRWLHVSAGLGHNPYAPYRFACRPEATLIELTG